MFKKINQYLLTHHPLIWNLKLPWVLLAALIIHICFFIWGYTVVTPANMSYANSLEKYVNDFPIAFSILVSVIVLLIWIIFFLRNNAFKSFLSLTKGHVLKTFLLICLIIFSCISFYESLYFGVRTKVKNITNWEQMLQEKKIIEQAQAFIPVNYEDYFIGNRWDKYLLYKHGSFSEYLGDYQSHGKKANRFVYTTIREAGDSTYHSRIDSSGATIIEPYINQDGYQVIPKFDSTYARFKELIVDKEAFAIRNYLHVQTDTEPKYFEAQKTVDTIITQKDKARATELLTKYFAIAKKYSIANNIESIKDSFINFAFNKGVLTLNISGLNHNYYNYDKNVEIQDRFDSNLVKFPFVRKELTPVETNNYGYNEYEFVSRADIKFANPLYMEVDDIKTTYENIEEAYTKKFYNYFPSFAICLGFTLALSILLFCFKHTNGKVFIFSIVASGIILILLILIGVLTKSPLPPIIILNLLILSFFTLFWIFKNNSYKFWAGLSGSLFLYLFPFSLPLILLQIWNSVCYESDIKTYVLNNNKLMQLICSWRYSEAVVFFYWFCFVILFTAFVGSWLVKKWNIMPDE